MTNEYFKDLWNFLKLVLPFLIFGIAMLYHFECCKYKEMLKHYQNLELDEKSNEYSSAREFTSDFEN